MIIDINMNESFEIKYSYAPNLGFKLSAIGESFIGFDAILKDILEIAQLGESVKIKTNKVEHSSILVINSIELLSSIPFDNIGNFLEFLKMAAPELLKDANTYFSAIGETHRSINNYFADNQFDQAIVSGLVVAFILKTLELAGKTKNKLKAIENQATPKQLNRIKRMVEGGRYTRALRPIIEGGISSINITSLNKIIKRAPVTISKNNFEEYLPEDNKILPDFINGNYVTLVGSLRNLESTRGDFLKLKVNDIDSANSLLTCTAADGVDIESFAKFFKKTVTVEAEVSRKTMYKRPELIITSMRLRQNELTD